ncbi:MAG: hypothetical protein V4692_05340, partial [Bdellovibrionota bacterium]
LPALSLGVGYDIIEVRSNHHSNCAVLQEQAPAKNHIMKCWGASTNNVLGDGTLPGMNRGDSPNELATATQVGFRPTVTKILDYAISDSHGCAIVVDTGAAATYSQLDCWGRYFRNEIGHGSRHNTSSLATPATDNWYLNLVKADGVTPAKAVKVSVGVTSTCVVTDEKRVACLGENASGLLGLGNTSIDAGAAWGPVTVAGRIPVIDLGTDANGPIKIVDVAVGEAFACAQTEGGKVKCWGRNDRGQLGNGLNVGDYAALGDQPTEMGNNLPYVDLGTNVVAKQIYAGRYNVCVVAVSGKLYCWGEGQNGSNGSLNTLDIGADAGQMGSALAAVDLGPNRKAISVSVSETHTCAVLDNNTMKCWGLNNAGQLGQGDRVNRGGAPDTMGLYLPYISFD